MIVQGAFLCMCCVVINLKPPEFWACRIAWGAVGGCLQGNVYMLKAASSMAVIDFGACMTNAVRFKWFQPPPPTHATVPLTTPPPNLQTFWLYTWVFIFIAATGLLVNALAMRYYKATFCGELVFGRMLTATICGGSVEQTTNSTRLSVCSFVGWYNVSAAAASAAFFGSNVVGVPLVLYISGELARHAQLTSFVWSVLLDPSPRLNSHPHPHSNPDRRTGARGWRGDGAGIAVLPGCFERGGRCVLFTRKMKKQTSPQVSSVQSLDFAYLTSIYYNFIENSHHLTPIPTTSRLCDSEEEEEGAGGEGRESFVEKQIGR